MNRKRFGLKQSSEVQEVICQTLRSLNAMGSTNGTRLKATWIQRVAPKLKDLENIILMKN